MYYPDPAAALGKLARVTRRDGIIAFQELDIRGATAFSPAPLMAKCVGWIGSVLQEAGANIHMGTRLHASFVAAGLPAPTLRLDAAIGAGRGHPAYAAMSHLVRTVLPQLERLGLATMAEMQIESLRDRLEEEVAASGGVITMPALIGAWSRIP